MGWPRFTRPDGVEVAINPANVAEVRAPLPSEMEPRAKAVIVLNSGFQAVRESVADVERALGI